jgi:hypothetical protein
MHLLVLDLWKLLTNQFYSSHQSYSYLLARQSECSPAASTSTGPCLANWQYIRDGHLDPPPEVLNFFAGSCSWFTHVEFQFIILVVIVICALNGH